MAFNRLDMAFLSDSMLESELMNWTGRENTERQSNLYEESWTIIIRNCMHQGLRVDCRSDPVQFWHLSVSLAAQRLFLSGSI
jgi:hypothetical protein